ncbi:hypothetical protein HOLleu_22673 [Holothuria leucospilota]|uniref:EGF-like domain-containing protein n=1 Tax=Holothuria leucospilota TaxID=206669 RepID=A0A9Q1H7L9_HOLLE|nr:hypothetical protein HOLleu_22673 [Holothuria leucospilota]
MDGGIEIRQSKVVGMIVPLQWGHGAIIRFNEPAVRVVIDDPVSTLDENVMATITITDDDGVTPLANGAVVSFNVNLEYDAFLPFDRVMEPTAPLSITADGISTDFPVTLFVVGGETPFFQISFKLIATLQSDGGSAVPATVMERSTVEFRIYTSIAFHPQFLVLNPAVLKRKGDEDLYVYGIGSRTFQDTDDEIILWKDGSVVTGSRTLLLRRSFDTAATDQGKYWKIKRFSKRNDQRFGVYEMTSMFQVAFVLENVTAIVNPLSEHLNTNGIKTITVYRKTSDPTLLEAPLNFGVRRTSLSGSIRWFKDRRRVNTGPRYTIRKAEDAGLYILHRYTRRRRCWYAQILVHLARCNRNEVSILGSCIPSDGVPCQCLNGGVCYDVFSPICQCPPCFRGIFCEHIVTVYLLYSLKEPSPTALSRSARAGILSVEISLAGTRDARDTSSVWEETMAVAVDVDGKDQNVTSHVGTDFTEQTALRDATVLVRHVIDLQELA